MKYILSDKLISTLLISIFLVSCSMFIEDKKVKERRESFVNDLSESYNFAYKIAKLIALDRDIINIYKALHNKTGNQSMEEVKSNIVNDFGAKLKEKFELKIKLYEENLEIPFKFRFYVAPSFLWLMPEFPKGEDILWLNVEADRPFIRESLDKGVISTGLELESESLFYRVILPIMDEEGTILGGVEVYSDFSNFLDYLLKKDSKKIILVLLKSEYRGHFPQEKYKNLRDFIIYYENTRGDTKLMEELIETVSKRKFRLDERIIYHVPLKDFKDNHIGNIVVYEK